MTWHKRLFAFLLVLLPTQLGFHFWPEWAIVLGRRVDYLSPTIYLTDLIIVLLLSFWFWENRPKFHLWMIIPLIFFAAVNIWISDNQPVAIYKWIKVLEFGILGWYIVQTKPKMSLVIWNLSIGIFYSSLIAIGQFILQRSIGGPLWFLGERTFNIDTPGIARVVLDGREMLRAYATFSHPNVLGGFLAITLPLLMKSKKSLWTYTVFVTGLIAPVLTFSRSAWIIASLGIVLAYIGKGNLLVLMTLGFAEESLIIREQLSSAAITLWRNSPFFGIGLGNFLVRLPEVLPSRMIYFLQPAHNIFLLVLAEVGIVGLLFFIWLIWKGRSPILLLLLLLGFFDHYLLTLQQGQLLFTLVLALGLIK